MTATESGMEAFETEKDRLRSRVLLHLKQQGFVLTPAGDIAPVAKTKDELRSLHSDAVDVQRSRNRASLEKAEPAFLTRLAAGNTVHPGSIEPRLVLVEDRRGFDAALWRWCAMHWAVPVSSGYGRRIRFLVVDRAHHDSVIGLIGLGDPVFALQCRDARIGWDASARAVRLACVMDAFVLGAVPPYTALLGGKLVSLLAASTEVQRIFSEKYGSRTTLISRRDPRASLALVTTASALGRSSVYNRVQRPDGSLLMEPAGYTKGSGDFQFSGTIYKDLADFANRWGSGLVAHRHERWGAPAFRNRRETVQKAMRILGLHPRALRNHGVQRQVFLSRLAKNSFEFLRGETDVMDPFEAEVDDLSRWWRHRWAIPRSNRDGSWLSFRPQDWCLYLNRPE